MSASNGLILLIRLLIIKLDSSPIISDKENIGIREKGLKENVKPIERALPISMFATIDITNSSTEAIIKETKHCIKE